MSSPEIIPSQLLTYVRQEKTFVTEISDLTAQVSALWGKRVTQIVWRIKSARTGRITDWEFAEEVGVRDEPIGWRFKPTLKTWTEFPHLADHSFMIYND